MKNMDLAMKTQENIFETSPNQKSIYAINQLDPASTSYNITQVVIVTQKLDKDLLMKVIDKVINRYEAMKTSFHIQNSELIQKVHLQAEFEFNYGTIDSEDQVDGILKEFVKGYDLAIPKLLRFLLLKVSEEKYYFVLDVHHIIADGISVVMLIHEIVDEYNNIPHKIWKYQQSDVIAEKKKELLENGVEYKEYWQSKFQSEVPIIDLPFDHRVLNIKSNKAERIIFDTSKELMENLKKVAKNKHVTLFNLLLSTFYVFMSKLTGQEDLVIGIPVAGRNQRVARRAVGMFVNTVPFRLQYNDSGAFDDLVQNVTDELTQVLKYQDYPMNDLINELNLKKEVNRNFLFDVLFSYYSKRFGSKLGSVEKCSYKNNDAQFFFSMNVEEGVESLSFELEYYEDLFDSETITRFGERFITLLGCIAEDENRKLKDLDFLPAKERQTVMETFNNTDMSFDYNKAVFQLVEDSAARLPDKTAVIFDDKEITYKQMNEYGNQIAHMMVEKGLEEDNCVGIFMDRSDQMLETILGIWKAGGAYIPIDTAYPIDRILDIYEASQSKYMISLRKFITKDMEDQLSGVEIICLDELDLNSYPKNNPGNSYSCANLAYIIFTSGSTGKPKGAMVEQAGMVNHMLAKKNDLVLTEDSVIVQNASQCFDISVWQFFNSLIIGGTTLILSNDKVLDINLFLHYIMKNQVTVLEVVPSYLSIMIDKLKAKDYLKSLEYLVITGEKVSSDLVKKWFELDNGIKMVNAYGPTEAADDITHYVMSENPDVMNISVGKPIQNMKIYIIDKNKNICGIGIKGEIYVSGIGVGRGYIGDEQKTKAAFMTNPFNPSTKMYKTGDIGCWLADGNIEYLERVDYQVKIRGYRIELGEIEAKLLDDDYVKQAVVLDRLDKDNEKFLCAYIVCDGEVNVEKVKENLAKNLPYYMIPDHIIPLDLIPITNNGKTNRKKLLEIPIEITEKVSMKPQTWTQKKLALIWSEILNVETVGINDRFFELFGHSLKAIHMADLIKEEFKVDFKVEDVFKNDTIMKQEQAIEASKKTVKKDIVKAENRMEFKISPAQYRIFSVSHSMDNEKAYNMPGLFRIEGNLDKAKAEHAFGGILKRHSNLRANFIVVDDEIIQKISPDKEFHINEISVAEFREKDILERCVQTFNLEEDTLFRVTIIHSEENSKYLLIDMHHIISDGVSTQIIVEEFIRLYQGEELALKEYEYADYVLWQSERKEQIREQKVYWMNNFKDGVPELDLMTDFQRPSIASYKGKNKMMVIEKDTLAKLKVLASKTDSTIHMVLMGVYKVLLAKYTGKSDLVVGTVSAGRRQKEFRDIIGMFVNTLPIRTRQNQSESFQVFLGEVKQKMLEALENDEYQFDDIVKSLNIQRDMSKNPIFDTLFVMQDDYVDGIHAKGLSLKTIDYVKETSKFDIEFQAYENKEQLYFDMSYKESLFKEETITTMLSHYKYILEQVISNPDVLLKEITIIKEEELQKIQKFNSVKGDYDINLSIIDLFEEKVFINPYNTALIMDDQNISYYELNNRVNQLAHILIDEGVHSKSRVAIIMDDSFEMMESILAILKLGAVYVPIDPSFPQNRIQLMIHDSMSELLLYTEEKDAKYVDIVNQLNVRNCTFTKENTKDIPIIVNGNEVACIVYTSGTTGLPKGNLVLHKNIVRVVYHTNYVEFDQNDTVLQTAHYGFDGSFFNMFGALLNGARLVLCSRKNLLDLDYISDLITNHKVTMFFATTSLFNVWVDSIGEVFKNLRCVVFGGEKASNKHCSLALKYLEGGCLINGYGPTESTVFTTAYTMREQADVTSNIPIGKVITNTSVQILGISNQINPIGVPGELCISGHGLVDGYTNAKELMAKKFIIDPHNENNILYRTGDLAMWKEDGNIHFLGRIDNQVKINGYRIELEEIESTIQSLEHIKDIAVLIKETKPGSKTIVAFYTCDTELLSKDIINEMKKAVPQYMIPKYFKKLNSMPLNQNGKIDRQALSRIENLEGAKSSPRSNQELTDTQEILLATAQRVLGGALIDIEDDFYERGGDSVKAIQLSAALKKDNLSISTKDILLNPIMRELSECIQQIQHKRTYEKVVGEVNLLPVYQFYIEKNKDLNHFHQSVLLFSKETIDVEIMTRVFQLLVNTHDMLRAVYQNGTIICRDVDTDNLIEIKEYEYSQIDPFVKDIKDNILEIKSSVNLEKGPILKAAFFKVEGGTHFLINIHHFFVDTVSWRILLDDIMTSYNMIKNNKAEVSLIRTNSFKDWVDSIYEYAQSEEFRVDKEYWENVDNKSYSVIPTETKVESRFISQSKTTSIKLNEKLTENLLLHTNKAYNTKAVQLLLTALTRAMKEAFDMKKPLRILLEGHGREDILKQIDVSRTVGWFTTLFPVVFDLDTEALSDDIKTVKENMNGIPNNGIGYGLCKYLLKNLPEIDEQQSEEVSFNYLGAFDNTLESEEFSVSTIHNDYDQGDQMSMAAKLEVTVAIYHGKLQIDVTYNKHEFNDEKIREFLKTYSTYIKKIITHCMNKEKTEMTLSDFDDKNLSNDELNAITKLFA